MVELTKNQIERQFDRAASSYDEVAGLQQKMAERLIDWLVDDQGVSQTQRAASSWAESASLIDLGCGTGYALEQISQIESAKSWNLSGLDLSSEMLSVSQDRLAKSDRTANWFHADLQNTDFVDNEFDIVLSNAAIQWCELEVAAKELFRILKPGGKLLVSTFAEQTLSQWQSAFSKIEPSQPPRVHSFSSLAEIQTAFATAGFQVDQVEREQIELEYSTVDEMFASIKKLGATNAQQSRSRGMLGKEKYLRIREHFEERLTRDGQLAVTFDCAFLMGQKPD